jgi:hypothetical protein
MIVVMSFSLVTTTGSDMVIPPTISLATLGSSAVAVNGSMALRVPLVPLVPNVQMFSSLIDCQTRALRLA